MTRQNATKVANLLYDIELSEAFYDDFMSFADDHEVSGELYNELQEVIKKYIAQRKVDLEAM